MQTRRSFLRSLGLGVLAVASGHAFKGGEAPLEYVSVSPVVPATDSSFVGIAMGECRAGDVVQIATQGIIPVRRGDG